jgi:adenine-specific DNA-methyltransferase
VDKTEFYQHDQNWSNRMILGDSLQVMASLAERESLKGKVQCIYFDPPYGIKLNSNFQWSTTSRDVKDGNIDHITREPEQVKAFRDTWRDGIHSYLTYLRDRLTVARDLLHESGSIFVQIGDENVHRVRALMDEVFGDEQYQSVALTSSHEYSKGKIQYNFNGKLYSPNMRYWSTSSEGLQRLDYSERIFPAKSIIRYKMYFSDFPVIPMTNIWSDLMGASDVIYVVQTNQTIIQRCLLMTTDPGDLVLDPTCGSGTTAYVAEQWGRRWITIDTSRVALALARSRIMGARYPFYLLADSEDGYRKELELGGVHRYTQMNTDKDKNNTENNICENLCPSVDKNSSSPSVDKKFYNRLRHGFVYVIALSAALNTYRKSPFRVEAGARQGMDVHFGIPDKESEYMALPGGERAASFALLEWEVPRMASLDWTEPGILNALQKFWENKIAWQKAMTRRFSKRRSLSTSTTNLLRTSGKSGWPAPLRWKAFRPTGF